MSGLWELALHVREGPVSVLLYGPDGWGFHLERGMPWYSVVSWSVLVGFIEVRRWAQPPLSYEERLVRRQNVGLAVGCVLLTIAAALVIWAMWWATP